MINNQELPIGFTMELAQHSDILNRFSQMNKADQDAIVEKARFINSRDEMRNYVESIGTVQGNTARIKTSGGTDSFF